MKNIIKDKNLRGNFIKSTIKDKTFDEERALYNLTDTSLENCTFAGEADGESALKEAGNIQLKDCSFSLRYPLWHVKKFTLENINMDENTRAAIWYSSDGEITNCNLSGIKAVRECDSISLKDCRIYSEEFGWKSKNIKLESSEIESEYLFLDSKNIFLSDVNMKGKYSFQYVKHLSIKNCVLDTKDAFWHSKDVTVSDSIIKGEYLGWYSENLTLINCKIEGTQPLCHCKNLKLISCEMVNTDLAFEYSDVNAYIVGSIQSVKNPRSGMIMADEIGEIIKENAVMDCNAEIIIKSK